MSHSPDPELESLATLSKRAAELSAAILEHVEQWPSPVLSHHLRGLADVESAMNRQAERVAHERARAREREAVRAEQTEQRKYDRHTRDMAERLGITPEAFLELQEERRRGMRGAPGTVSYAPDHEVVR